MPGRTPIQRRVSRSAGRAPNVLTGAEVASLAIGAGFSRRDGSSRTTAFSAAAMAVAIAKQESGWNSNALNRTSGATGLWQIHGPGQALTGTPALFNPRANAIAAHAKYVAQGWDAWSVYPVPTPVLQDADAIVRASKGLAPRDPGKVTPITPGSLLGDAAGGLGGLFGGAFGSIVAVLKVAAGGAGLVFVGATVIFLAGRNMPATQAIGKAARLFPNPVAQGASAAIVKRSPTAGVKAATAGVKVPSRTDLGERYSPKMRAKIAEASAGMGGP